MITRPGADKALMNGPLAEVQSINASGRLPGFKTAAKSSAEISGPRRLNFAERPSNVPWPMNTSHNSPSGFATSFVNTLSNRVRSFSGLLVSTPMTKVCSPPFVAACFHKSVHAENCSPYSGSPAAPMTRTSVRCSLVWASDELGKRKINSKNNQHPTSNIEQPMARSLPTQLDVGCWMLVVGCSLFTFTAFLSSDGFPTPPQSSTTPTETPPACATMVPSTFP